MKDQIEKIIAEYLEGQTRLSNKHGEIFVQFEHPIKMGFNRAEYCAEIAAEIAEKLLPIVDQKTGWEDAPNWAQFKTTTNSGDIIYWEHQPVCSPLGFWIAGNHTSRYEVREIKKGHLEHRPK